MTQFHYTANRDGISERGTLQAASRYEAAKRLKAEGYAGVRLKRVPGDTGRFFQRLLGR